MLSINCNSRTSSEVLLIDTTTSHLEPFLVQPRQLDLLYHVEHWRNCLIILADTGPGQEYQVEFVQFNKELHLEGEKRAYTYFMLKLGGAGPSL